MLWPPLGKAQKRQHLTVENHRILGLQIHESALLRLQSHLVTRRAKRQFSALNKLVEGGAKEVVDVVHGLHCFTIPRAP